MAREIAKLSARQLRELVGELGSPPRMTNVSGDYWTRYDADLQAVVRKALFEVYLKQAEAVRNVPGSPVASIGVDWALVNRRAAEWASKYTFDLVKGIRENTQSATAATLQAVLQDAISRGITEAQLNAEIADALAGTFGPVRAEMIAVTEVTRAAANGEAGLAAEIAAQGVQMRPVWMTSEDEIVCPICGELNGMVGEESGAGWTFSAGGEIYELPPAHPNCRCGVGFQVVR